MRLAAAPGHVLSLILLAAGLSLTAGFVRVDSGRQRIRVDERDPYEGHFTRLTFDRLRCIQSLNVDCLVPLTGAEDIEIIYTQCSGNSKWRLAHYRNSGGSFLLATPAYARRIAIVSPQMLSVVDISVQPCNNSFNHNNFHWKHKECKSDDDETESTTVRQHASRKHRKRRRKFAVIEDVVQRRKRSVAEDTFLEYSSNGAPHNITEDIVVPSGGLLRITEGARLAFSSDTGIIAYGTVSIIGSKREPVLLYPSGERWRGVVIRNGSSSREQRSELRYVNVSGSVEGIRVEGPPFPILEHVTSDSNDNGVMLLADNTAKVVEKVRDEKPKLPFH